MNLGLAVGVTYALYRLSYTSNNNQAVKIQVQGLDDTLSGFLLHVQQLN
jgi:hypothetical protein